MPEQRAIIFDASTLISLSMAGLFDQIRDLKSSFKGHFLITKDVKKEIIDKPITIKKFELEAMRLKDMLEKRVLEEPAIFGINEEELNKLTYNYTETANSTFFNSKRDIFLIDAGEASCLALSKLLTQKGVKNVLAIDERTIRMICEKPDNLRKLLIKKLHTEIKPRKEKYKLFEGFKFIRSSELVYVAYKKGLIKLKYPNLLDALLYAVKFKGCAISGTEIEEIKNLD